MKVLTENRNTNIRNPNVTLQRATAFILLFIVGLVNGKCNGPRAIKCITAGETVSIAARTPSHHVAQ
jgi:hypothetical protein